MKRAKNAPPEELLAAYADGGVDDEERATVEQYLAENPRAREELEAIRELVARTRDAVPRPVEEPEWSKMARRILAMCDIEQDEPRTIWQRAGDRLASVLSGLFRPRTAVLLGAAAAAIVLFAIWRGDAPDPERAPGTAPAPSMAQSPAGNDSDRADDRDSAADRLARQPDSRPEVDWDAVDDILAESADDGDGDALGDGDAMADLDLDGDGDELGDGDDDDAAALEYAVGGGLELFAEPDYESWLGDLSTEELDALDALLRDTQAG